MAETTILNIDFGDTFERLTQIKNATRELTEENKKLAESIEKTGDETGELNKQMQQNEAAIRANAKEKRTLNKLVDDSIKAEKAQKGSIEANRAELSKLTAEYIKLAAPTKEQTERIKTLSDTLKKQEAAIGDTRRNVGNYASALEGAGGILKKFGVDTDTLKQRLFAARSALVETRKRLIEVQGNIGGASGATDGFVKNLFNTTKALFTTTKGLQIFKVALISTGIGAIVIALGLLVNAFLSTQRGIDAMNKVLEPIKLLFERTKDVIEDLSVRVFDRLVNAVKNPVQAFKDLGNAIEENIINRIKAFSVAGEGFSQILKGDFAGGLKTLGNSFIQFNTGITGGIDKLQEFGNAAGDVINQAVADGLKIAELTRQINTLEAAYASQREEKLATFQDLQDQAIQEGVSQKEKLKLLTQASEIRRKIEQDDLKLQDLKIERFKLQKEGDLDLVEVQKELNTLTGERAAIERAADQDLKKITNTRTALAKQAAKDIEDSEKKIAEDKAKYLDVISKLQDEFGINEREKIIDSFDEKLELIKGQSESEIELRKAIEEKKQQELDKFDNEILAKKIQKENSDALDRLETDLINARAAGEIIFEEQLAIEEETQKQILENEQLGLDEKERLIAESNERILQINRDQADSEVELAKTLQEAKFSIAESGAAALSSLLEIFGKGGEAAAKFQKALAVFDIAIQTAKSLAEIIPLAIQAAAATGPGAPFVLAGYVASAAATVLGGIAAAKKVLSSAKEPSAPSFAEGGKVVDIGGRSHAHGGTKISLDGVPVAEAEAGEKMFILKKTASDYINKFGMLNQMFGGRSWNGHPVRHAALGGNIASSFDGGFVGREAIRDSNSQDMLNAIRNMPPPVVRVTEINKVQSDVNRSVSVSEL